MFVILAEMIEKQYSAGIKRAYVTTDNNKTKSTAAIPMVGAKITAAMLLLGLSLISSYYQPVLAQQQNMTGGDGSAADGGATSPVNATARKTMDGIALGGNATTRAGGAPAGNESTSEVRTNIEQALMALQNNDTQGALIYLDMALSVLGGGSAAANGTQGNINTTAATVASGNAINTGSEDRRLPVGGTSAPEDDDETSDDDDIDSNSSTDTNRRETDTEEEDSECGGVTVGGTSAADDYGCPPDPDA